MGRGRDPNSGVGIIAEAVHPDGDVKALLAKVGYPGQRGHLMGRQAISGVSLGEGAGTKILQDNSVDAALDEGLCIRERKVTGAVKRGVGGGQGVPGHGGEVDDADKSKNHGAELSALDS